MRRRVMMGKRELVEVVEELKSSGTWMVPAGCKFVDVFIVGGGGSGASSGPERGGGGGGSGYVKTYLDVPVTPESVVSYSIGKGGDRVVSMSAYDDQKNGLPGSESWFKSNSIKALGGNGGRYSGRGGDGGSGGGSGRPTEKTAGYIGGSDGSDNDIVFESDKKRAKLTARNKYKILDALEKAITISCKNLPVLEGRSAILIDHSGSVRGDMGGSSEVSAFSKTNTAVIGNLFGCMIASVLPDVFIGMFGDKLINYEYDRSKGVLWNNKKSFTAGGECGGATENGLFAFLDKCVKDKIKVDNLYVISDMQIGDGESVVWEKSSNYKYGKFAELLKGFKKVNPNCKIVSISIQGYGSEMFYRGSNILNIAGWSESIFDVINSKFCGYKNMIEEIKKIKI